jgi:hypothetical protein
MKNSVVCPNCDSENPFFNSICSDCSTYLRDRVYNLDLWSIFSLIIESPSKAFNRIIFSEHKNFIFFILLFVSLKFLIEARFLSMISVGNFQSTVELHISYFIIIGVTTGYFLIFSILYSKVGSAFDITLRFKDTFALIIYSQLPYLFGLVVLFTLELVIFGDYLFSKNPSPFTIKSTLSYLFFILEIAIIFWSTFLLFKAFLTQSRNKSFSLISSLIFFVFFWSMIYFCSMFVFAI